MKRLVQRKDSDEQTRNERMSSSIWRDILPFRLPRLFCNAQPVTQLTMRFPLTGVERWWQHA
jgi:hypothetical protein